MKQNYLRRNFLKNSILATSGLILFPTIASASNSNRRKANVLSHQTDIRRNLFGKQIEISGQIFDASGKNTLSGAQLEFWHLSPNSEELGYKGKLVTDENGRYHLTSDYPSQKKGTVTTVHFKVSKNEIISETELKVSEFDAFITGVHWEKNNQLKEDLLFPKHSKKDLKTEVTFNISLNN